MPLPLILGGLGLAAYVAGLVQDYQADNINDEAQDLESKARKRNEQNVKFAEQKYKQADETMAALGQKALDTVAGFKPFLDILEKIRNRPTNFGVNANAAVASFDPKVCFDDCVAANRLISEGGANIMGRGFAKVAKFGTLKVLDKCWNPNVSSENSNQSGMSNNKELAAAKVRQSVATTMEIGTGTFIDGYLSKKAATAYLEEAKKAMSEVIKNEETTKQMCEKWEQIRYAANKHLQLIRGLDLNYGAQMCRVESIYECSRQADGSVDWFSLSGDDRVVVDNTWKLVGILHKLCTVRLLNQDGTVNTREVNEVQAMASEWLNKRA